MRHPAGVVGVDGRLADVDPEDVSPPAVGRDRHDRRWHAVAPEGARQRRHPQRREGDLPDAGHHVVAPDDAVGVGRTVKKPPLSATASTSSSGAITPDVAAPDAAAPRRAASASRRARRGPRRCGRTGATPAAPGRPRRPMSCRQEHEADGHVVGPLDGVGQQLGGVHVGRWSGPAACPGPRPRSSRARGGLARRRPARRATLTPPPRPAPPLDVRVAQMMSKPTAATPPAASASTSRAIFARLQGQIPSASIDRSSMATITTLPDGVRGPRSV